VVAHVDETKPTAAAGGGPAAVKKGAKKAKIKRL